MNGISPTDSVMAIRNAILQKNAALRDIAQTGPAAGAGATGGVQDSKPGAFTEALSSALQQVNGLQTQAGEAAASFERWWSTPAPVEVMRAAMKGSQAG